MIYIYAVAAGIAGAGLGWTLVAAITVGIATATGVSNFEGAVGYLAFWGTGPVGGLIGLLAATVAVLRFKGGYRTLGAIAKRGAAVIVAVVAIGAATVAFQIAGVEHFSDGNPTVYFEIRMPAGQTILDRKSIDIELQAGSQRSGALLADDWLRIDGDQTLLAGQVQLYTRTANRLLVVTLPDQSRLLFDLGLPATPRVSESFGEWRRVAFLDDGKAESKPRRAGASDDFHIRLRIPDWTKPYVQPEKQDTNLMR